MPEAAITLAIASLISLFVGPRLQRRASALPALARRVGSSLRRLLGPAGATGRKARVIAAGAALIAGAATAAFTASLSFACVAALSGWVVTIRAAASFEDRQLRTAAMRAWPEILGETELRVASLGSPLALALFASAKSADVRLVPAFAQAERAYAITGSLPAAMSELAGLLPDGGSHYICELLSVVGTAPGGEVARLLGELGADMAAERERTLEYSARLAGLRFARLFVFIVPAGMTLAGAGIAGISAYRSGAGRAGIAFSVVVLALCWAWASRLGRAPSSYAESAK
ncbi:MAG: hypothetical protein M0Z91_02975 [Actinomycetota bacterium]|nr:hypothetical protein [Actinomycetota bacterium]